MKSKLSEMEWKSDIESFELLLLELQIAELMLQKEKKRKDLKLVTLILDDDKEWYPFDF